MEQGNAAARPLVKLLALYAETALHPKAASSLRFAAALQKKAAVLWTAVASIARHRFAIGGRYR